MVVLDYRPPLLHRSAFLSTVLPNLFRPIDPSSSEVELKVSEDGDQFAIGKSLSGSDTLVIMLHGLEGSLNTRYMHGMSWTMKRAGYDVIAINHRGCGGFENKKVYTYHSGFTNDLSQVVKNEQHNYRNIWIVGFSLGANIAIKYALEESTIKNLRGVVAISAPLDLKGSASCLRKPTNYVYQQRFLRSLKRKALIKAKSHPINGLDVDQIKKANTLKAFDEAFTAPVNGFLDAADYYAQCSTYNEITQIPIPCLLISAQNDSFLSALCYPKPSGNLHTLYPKHGGHVGFASDLKMKKQFWHEVKAKEFIKTFTP